MKKELKQKIAYWIETMLYFAGLAFGASILVGGFYALWVVIQSLFF